MNKPIKPPSDLLIIFIWMVLTLISVITPNLGESLLRTVIGIPLVLFIPGYVLTAALFPKKDELEGIERLALSFGLSIAVVPLLGLVLNFTFGIRLIPVMITLCLYTVTLLVFAAFRREKLPENERFRVSFHPVYKLMDEELNAPMSKTDRILTGILIFSIALAIGLIFFVITTPKIGERFTEFYILGYGAKAENYPTIMKYNSSATILIGVVNHEYIPVNYTVRIVLDKKPLADTWISLDHNTTWEKNMTFIPDKNGTDMKLEFWLFKEDNFTAPYRELHLWINVTG